MADQTKDQKAQGHESQNPDSLKAREYRDKEGDVHHHTKTYMDQHDKTGGSGDRPDKKD